MSLFDLLPAQPLLQQIERLAPGQCYLVGGAPRDLLLGCPALDLDIVIEGDAPAVGRALQRAQGGKLTQHAAFLTATWQAPGGPALDLITARRETYPRPAALPQVTPSTLADDLARRDFSLNTLAIRLADGALLDQHHAQADLQNGLIRVLHDASFFDDPTRLYRAARYATRYGFSIAPSTLALFPAALPLVARLSPERLRHELDLILDEPRALETLMRLDQLGLLEIIAEVLPRGADLRENLAPALGGLSAPWSGTSPLKAYPPQRALTYTLWFSPLPASDLQKLQARLILPAWLYQTVSAAAALRRELPTLRGSRPSAWVARLESVPLLAVYAIFLATRQPELEIYAQKWRDIHPHLSAARLQALGVAPGPRFGEVLRRLRAARLDGEISSAAEEMTLLQKLCGTP
ncbi:MAG: hypothetical protein CO094_10660 [Anaerolineae bacterium CG_4_9_14_3_um_filter_57_17]|nr:CCA tRNA nucleotidyltransferase [bacterium]NCT21337.1 CCA tRNA nucleotidyltransferase [bacterium]OIO83685.1 MAG: hypothetical protein AUK01_11760 [Anaerolineae bacterium CG2_30_57_67]PJB65157.1 MAG: hypothetical protein CO094_10660 [Anaerolineae bacterium CG_4_9_14_3_um_filter_57_17]